jgi:hypothetical protein
LSDLTEAMNFYINTLLGKEPPSKQKDAVARLTKGEKKEAEKAASKEVKENKEKSSQKTAERVTREEPFDITELKMRQDLENPRDVLPAPRSQN